MAYHAVHPGYHLPGLEWLTEKTAAGRTINPGKVQLPGHYDDLDQRPTFVHGPRKSMLPGICMSVHISAMSDLDSRIARASSASTASTGV
jgi:hypothetical protein